MEISKELLSEVYNFKVKDFVKLGTNETTYEVRFEGLKNGLSYNIINIYELVHKCKEWAWNNGYQIRSSFRSIIMGSTSYGELIDCNNPIETDEGNIYEMIASYGVEDDESEIEVIIRLSEWVLEKLNEKQLQH